MGKKIWVQIKVDDNCLWDLNGKVFKKKPSLKDMQDSVGGLIEYMPQVYLMPEVKEMIVNEEGLLHGLRDNYLANMQLKTHAPRVVGDVLVKVDEAFITKDFWLKLEE
ncbi:MAG: hypothetical protein GOVbin1782_18 [Prokaryotic dsDNA virus sp.]|nr:MAG: hypothetical protein GOVbin1782_18 [Prokaryotic dsDNA virus sp.]|tara:strand:+ start:15737 stop:16060 length:324 start_codon:yes stop_codon:yes gene_type:complete